MVRRKRRARGRKKNVEITYCIKLNSFELSYSFAVQTMHKFFPGPFWEHLAIQLAGTLIDPENFRGRALKVTIMGSRTEALAAQRPEESRLEPICVGTLTLRGEQSEFLGSVPFDVFPFLYKLLRDGEVQFFILGGPPLYRGSSEIRSMHFEKNYNPEDWGRAAENGSKKTEEDS